MTGNPPLVMAIAPNGARYSKNDHPALPLTAYELAETAVECLEAGATMIHLHVRDENGQHSLEPEHYRPALKAVKDAVGDRMLIQVTSEAAGIYDSSQQMDLMEQLMPDCMSLALREFLPKDSLRQRFSGFLHGLNSEGCLIQYILYDEDDYNLYQQLIKEDDIPINNHSLLFVLGRYLKQEPSIEIVDQNRHILSSGANWMVCTFGTQSHRILSKSIDLGCHVRVGFENGFFLPDGTIASTNEELITNSLRGFHRSERSLASIEETRLIMGQSAAYITVK